MRIIYRTDEDTSSLSSRKRYESHPASIVLPAKALAKVLLENPKFQVYYPEKRVLENILKAETAEDLDKVLHGHFRFVVTMLENGGLPLHPSVVCISDNPNSTRDVPYSLLAARVDVDYLDLIEAVSWFFNRNPDAMLSDLFEYIDVDNGYDVKDVTVKDFKVRDNGDVRDVQEDAILWALSPDEPDMEDELDDVAEFCTIGSKGMKSFNTENPAKNAMMNLSPVYDTDMVQISGPTSVDALAKDYLRQLNEWFRFRVNTYTNTMWKTAWAGVAEDLMSERYDNDLDYNPYTRECRKRRLGINVPRTTPEHKGDTMNTKGYMGRKVERSSMKRLKKEGYMADDAHNNWSTFASELQVALSRLGIDADIWINDMGFMEVVCTETEESCVLFTSVMDRPYFSMRLNIQLPSGSFVNGPQFETDDYPDNADEIAKKIAWIGEKNERRIIRRRASR